MMRLSVALADRDAFPEGDPVPDPGGGGLGVRIIPSGVAIFGAVHLEMVIMGNALPRADRRRVAVAKQRGIDRVAREIMIAFDDQRVVAVGDRGAVPSRFHHALSYRNRTARYS